MAEIDLDRFAQGPLDRQTLPQEQERPDYFVCDGCGFYYRYGRHVWSADYEKLFCCSQCMEDAM